MKLPNPLKVEREAEKALRNLLGEIPGVSIRRITHEPPVEDATIDLLVEASTASGPLRIAVEVKSNGQPRLIKDAINQLRHYLEDSPNSATPIVMAPFLSEQSRAICTQENMGYIDFHGNARVVTDMLYIDRQVPGRPDPERRALRSLFKPKSARILRCLLADIERPWRVTELAETAKVSVGLVSTISSALRERGWMEHTDDGFLLVDPSALLDSWAEEYEHPKGEVKRFYSHLHGKALLDKIQSLPSEHGRIVMSSFTAGDWFAPYVRQSTSTFYADEDGLSKLIEGLELTSPARGANIVVRVPDEYGVLDDAVSVANGLEATSPVQTYLDLMHAGERGQEGAEHLRAKLLDWPN